MTQPYQEAQPDRSEIDAWRGLAVVDFGTNWCGFCRAAEPAVEAALAKHPQVKHLKVEDGPGRPLGRSFKVKLWPTLVFLRDGQEVSRLVRPNDTTAIQQALGALEQH
ncbi:thioredoxin family protein [Piscinibacter sp. HJYY11]|uniref:thioredoxin family protein n=1 Tax=Piscinibacter sp. HJYY11 TaxID=2801333 RepID=UPI00191CBF9D|nr:thioredoxin family protein [Piscinibacter sp. HJYY11]MBL0729547.1 thioredoxin family protein [Piscinibacter sp. HJYY11]